ncbi:hypothetical protein [Pedobacter sandarakinus]|uniref:hypothetical protein n=1 Tax=Pedobacter sandarakinus TaxID=353156 RepID=UPI002245F5A3|nr:hypothetical protein [Pedobacter sandarakinus]MCX2576144.1 hypothetical protein [Pedobacter sandarakinus]
MKNILLVLSLIFLSVVSFAQTGINVQTPLSTLHNGGSYAGKYLSNPGTTYTLGDDYIVDYNDNIAGTVYTLPSISEGTSLNRNGRVYFIRNGSASNTLTIRGSGSETLNDGQVSSNSYFLSAKRSIMVVRNATVSGGTNNTWAIVDVADIQPLSKTYLRTVKNTAGPTVAMGGRGASEVTFLSSTGNTDLFDTDLIVPTSKKVQFTFVTGINEYSTSTTQPYLNYFLELYDTTTGNAVAGTGQGTQLSIQVEMVGGEQANFTLVDEIDLPAGTYNARLKSNFGAGGPALTLGFISYSIIASYSN